MSKELPSYEELIQIIRKAIPHVEHAPAGIGGDSATEAYVQMRAALDAYAAVKRCGKTDMVRDIVMGAEQ